jgi:hypothetical protein
VSILLCRPASSSASLISERARRQRAAPPRMHLSSAPSEWPAHEWRSRSSRAADSYLMNEPGCGRRKDGSCPLLPSDRICIPGAHRRLFPPSPAVLTNQLPPRSRSSFRGTTSTGTSRRRSTWVLSTTGRESCTPSRVAPHRPGGLFQAAADHVRRRDPLGTEAYGDG